MNVKELHRLLGELMKEHPETKELPIRVIEDSDYEDVEDKVQGDPKTNYWLSFDTDMEVSLTGQSGYEQSGEVRLIGHGS
tara:strand:+ start:218 stop:457 length:240 start_codon:yes stop_codon:yes gene_type:complete